MFLFLRVPARSGLIARPARCFFDDRPAEISRGRAGLAAAGAVIGLEGFVPFGFRLGSVWVPLGGGVL